jgi:hypothetical protein
MERMDEELLDDTEYYSEYLAKSGLAGLKKKAVGRTRLRMG